MKLSNYFFIGIAMLSLTGCALFGGEEDVVEVAPLPKVENKFIAQKIWEHNSPNSSDVYSLLGPNHYRGVVYAANRTGMVTAVSASTGETVWSIDLSKTKLFNGENALLSGGVSVDFSYVYVGSERAILYVINRSTGKLVWEKSVKGEILSRPVSADSRVVIYTANGHLQTFNKNTGKQLWDTEIPVPGLSLRGNSVPKITKGEIIVGDARGQVNAYSILDGQLVWQQRISMPVGSSEIEKLIDVNATPVVEKNIVYAIGYNGNIVSFDLEEGHVIWKQEIGSTHNFAVQKETLFVVDQHDTILSISKKGGGVNWKQTSFLNRQLTDPVLYQKDIVVGDFEGYLYWINADDGSITAKFEVDSSGITAAPIVVNNQLIVQTKNGNIYAFKKN